MVNSILLHKICKIADFLNVRNTLKKLIEWKIYFNDKLKRGEPLISRYFWQTYNSNSYAGLISLIKHIEMYFIQLKFLEYF